MLTAGKSIDDKGHLAVPFYVDALKVMYVIPVIEAQGMEIFMAQQRTIFQRIYKIAGIDLPDEAVKGPRVEYYGSGHYRAAVLVAMESPDLITVTNLKPGKHARADVFSLWIDRSQPQRPMLRASWSKAAVEVSVLYRPASVTAMLQTLRESLIALNAKKRSYTAMYPTVYLNILDDAANLNRNPKYFYRYRTVG